MSSVPDEVRRRIQAVLWKRADEVGWKSLGQVARASQYKVWTEDPEIGGVLARHLKKGEIRVYIKDTLLKPYLREYRADARPYLLAAGLPSNAEIVRRRIKPHGVELVEGGLLVWASARDWKLALMSLYEWAYYLGTSHDVKIVFEGASGRFAEGAFRKCVVDAASRLGIMSPIWLD